MWGQRDNLCAFWPCDNSAREKIILGKTSENYFCKVLSKSYVQLFLNLPFTNLNLRHIGRHVRDQVWVLFANWNSRMSTLHSWSLFSSNYPSTQQHLLKFHFHLRLKDFRDDQALSENFLQKANWQSRTFFLRNFLQSKCLVLT